MNKKGFTLVELMVVIIAMGILAAIGIPKLYGSIAKSRTSEVQPAAAAYVKLQKAYMAERGGVGTWKDIGYAAPGKKTKTGSVDTYKTEYFTYGGSDIEIKATVKKESLLAKLGNPQIGWIAKSQNKLNECASGSSWTVTVKAINDTTVEYQYVDLSSAGCSALTLNWSQVDYGVTYKDIEFEKAEMQEMPADETQETTTETDPTTTPEVNVSQALDCHQNGWLNGGKLGWAKPTNPHHYCYVLRQQYYASGILTCTDKVIKKQCLHFGYTEKGKCLIFKEGCPEGESNESPTTDDKTSLKATCSDEVNTYINGKMDVPVSALVTGCNEDCSCDVSRPKYNGKGDKSVGTSDCSSIKFTDGDNGSKNNTVTYTLKVTRTIKNTGGKNTTLNASCDFKVRFTDTGY